MSRRLLLTLALLVSLAQASDAQTRLLGIVADFPTSQPIDAWTMDGIRSVAAGVDTFTTSENSYGLAPQVTDIVYVGVIDDAPIRAQTSSSGAQFALMQGMQAAAITAGVDLTPYGCNLIYFYPDTIPLANALMSTGCGILIQGHFGRVYPPGFQTLAHEQGHELLGLNHSHAIGCEDGTPGMVCANGVSLRSYEYGDNYDLMGHGEGHFNCWVKAQLGWIALTPMTADGDYLLSPLEVSSGNRCLIFYGGRKNQLSFAVEYRQPIGHDAQQLWADPANTFNGVIVRWLTPNGWSLGGMDAEVLRMNRDNPAFPSLFNEAALTVGQSFCPPDTRKAVTLVSASPSGAVVRLGGRCR